MSTEVTMAELKQMFKDLLQSQQENAEQFRRTDEMLSQRFRETDEKFRETDEMLSQRFRETDEKFRETDEMLSQQFRETEEQFRETDKKIKEAMELFTTQWGKLMESLVEGDLVNILRSRNILVNQTQTRGERQP